MNNTSLAIDVHNLKKSFHGKPAVIDFSLQLQQGAICGFLGPNGSGKTTTMRMLCGLLTPDSGRGQCLGFDILQHSYEIKKQLGYMTQSFSLYHDLTAYENLDLIARIFGIKKRKSKISATLKVFDLSDRKDQLAGEMSGGWRQRLALAGCMLHEPKLLLLDEPTAGVDPKARRYFWDNIFILAAQGITTLVSTHYMDEAERCSQLVYISNGHVLVKGSIQEIIQKSQLNTWLVTGDDLMSLTKKIQDAPGVDQVIFFGNSLHISGKDPRLLEQTITPFKDENWQLITPSLEDSFISFVESAGDHT